MPKLSIIIPVYNVEKYLVDCVESVLNQTYEDFELILIDDGSTDKSGLLCDELKKRDSRIVVIHQKNQGVSITRNVGLDIAKGEYITFLDADDLIDSQMYQILLEIALEEEADIAIGDAKIFHSEEEIQELIDEKKLWRSTELQFYSRDELICDLFSRPSWTKGFSVNKVYKKKCIANTRFKPNLKVREDLKFLIDLYLEGKCRKSVRVPFSLYFYRMNEQSATHQKGSLVFETKTFKKEIIPSIRAKSPQHMGEAIFYWLDTSVAHILKCRAEKDVKKFYKSKIILKVKMNMIYWIMFAKVHKLLKKETIHRYLWEGIVKS